MLKVLIFLSITLFQSVFSAPEGYYAGNTTDGLGMGIHINNDNEQDSLRIAIKVYNEAEAYLYTQTNASGRPAFVSVSSSSLQTYNNTFMADTLAWCGGGDGAFTMQGNLRYEYSVFGRRWVFSSADGTYSWSNNLCGADYRYTPQINWDDCYYIGKTLPGAGPSELTITPLSSTQARLVWNHIPGGTAYRVYRATSQSGSYSYIRYRTINSDTITLAAGTTYWLRLQGINIWGTSDSSTPVSVTMPPATPASSTITPVSSSALGCSWGSVTGATNYNIYYGTSPAGTYTYHGSTASLSYNLASLGSGTRYYVKIAAVNSGGSSSLSSYGSGLTYSEPPANISGNALSNSSILISWKSATGATSTNIYRSLTSSGTYSFVGSSTTTSFTNNSLTSNTIYYYKLTSVNGSGESALSSYMSVRTRCQSPVGLYTFSHTASSMTVGWSATPGASSYYVYRSTTSDGVYTYLGTTAGTNYTATSLSSGTIYYFKVSAINSGGESNLSTYTSGLTLPAQPTNLSITSKTASSFVLKWDTVASAINYRVYGSSTNTSLPQILVTTASSCTVNGLNHNTTYYFEIRAENSNGLSAASSRISETTNTQTILSISTHLISAGMLTNDPQYVVDFGVTNVGSGIMTYSIKKSALWLAIGSLSPLATGESSTVEVTLDVTGLSAGLYYDTLLVYSNGALNDSQKVAIKLTVSDAPMPLIGLGTTSIGRTIRLGQDASNHALVLRNMGTGTLNYAVSSPTSWISLNRFSGSCTLNSDTVTLSFTTNMLDTGVHAGLVVVSDPAAPNSPESVVVAITVLPLLKPLFSVSIDTIVISAYTGDSIVPYQFTISNYGDTSGSVTVSKKTSILSVTPSSPIILEKGSDTSVIISFSTATLSAGSYVDTISVVFADSILLLPVSISLVERTEPLICLSADTIKVHITLGEQAPVTNFLVGNCGTGLLDYGINSSADWLLLSKENGAVSVTHDTVELFFNTTSLDTGRYQAQIISTNTEAAEMKDTLIVVMTIVPKRKPVVVLSADTLVFSVLDDSVRSVDPLVITNVGDTVLVYRIEKSQEWLLLSKSNGILYPGETDTIFLSCSDSVSLTNSHSAYINVVDTSGATPQGLCFVMAEVLSTHTEQQVIVKQMEDNLISIAPRANGLRAEYSAKEQGIVSFFIHDIRGRRVAYYSSRIEKGVGSCFIQMSGNNKFRSGIFFVTYMVGESKGVKKVVFVL